MAGIYLHIPFCAKKCNYCDFYSIVPLARKQEFVTTLIKEIKYRKNYLEGEALETIYFGGGTPSILTIDEISSILSEITKNYKLSSKVELTIEANPDDLSLSYLKGLMSLGVNRLSIGIQSFSDKDLQFLKRTHNSKVAYKSVERAFSVGVENISIDLIYGLPNLSLSAWELNLKKAFELPIKHLSSYHLTYESGTLLNKRLKEKRFAKLNEEKSIQQFELLMQYTEQHKMPYYEISNFAIKDFYSKHNLSYWQQKKYLGVGPSAHSFNGISREWNVSNLVKYIGGIENGSEYSEKEILSPRDMSNEFLITNLRTKWGVDLGNYKSQYGVELYNRLLDNSNKFIKDKLIRIHNNKLVLTQKGIFVSDLILEELYQIES